MVEQVLSTLKEEDEREYQVLVCKLYFHHDKRTGAEALALAKQKIERFNKVVQLDSLGPYQDVIAKPGEVGVFITL